MSKYNLLTTAEAAAYLSMSKAYLERDRWRGAVIPFTRIGGRTVRYRREDLDLFIKNSIDPYRSIDPDLPGPVDD